MFAIAVLLCLTLFGEDINRSLFRNGAGGRSTCSLSRSLARSLQLTTPVSYTRLRIDVVEAEGEAGYASSNTSDNASKELGIDMPTMHPLRRKWNFDLVAAADEASCTTSTTLEMPRPPHTPPDAQHIVFGVSTPLHRLEDSLQAFSHWAAHTGTTIYALVDREHASDRNIARLTRKAANMGISLDIARQNVSSEESSFGDRYFAMVKHVYERVRQQEQGLQFVGFIDDDTFFPNMRALLERLGTYDAAQPHYIGGLSEDQVLLDLIGHMAYGGAGVFLTLPMLAQVYEHWDDCEEHHSPGGGDKRLKECILGHTTSELEVEEKLHQVCATHSNARSASVRHKLTRNQIDLHGDVSGFYEAGRPLPLSIHHWKSWNHVDIVAMAAVARVCGDECLLRRYRFRDGWYLANGFSVFRYSDWDAPDGEREREDAMEETWNLGGDYVDRLGPLRPKDEGKEDFRLVRSIVDGGQVRQFYVQRDDAGDGVVEVEWRRI